MKTLNKTSDTAQHRTFFSGMNGNARKWLWLSIGVGVMASLITLIVGYFFVTAGLNRAERNLQACKNLLDSDNFFEAEHQCEQAQEFLSSVRLVGQGKKEKLNRDVRELLASPKLQQGLLGNIMVDGKFVSLPTKELILAFKKAKTNGDIFFEQKSWMEAEINYQRALEVAAKTTEIDTLLLARVRKQISRTQFNTLLQKGEKSLIISNWQEALIYFDEALLLAKNDPNIPPEDMSQLTQLIHRTQFSPLCDQGDEFFEAGNWDAALRNYEKALKIGTKIHSPQSENITGLKANIARTKLYITIAKGKNAFADSQWDDAIDQYEKAIALLMENDKILSQVTTNGSSDKLSRILLQTTIIRDKQQVASYLKSDKREAAMDKLQDIQGAITDSPAGDLPEFQVIMKETSQQLNEVKTQLLIARQTDYLLRNYQQLFIKHYPEATLSVLSSPHVEYVNKIGDKLLFRMQCTEDNRGRPLRLQIKYLYSPATDDWQLYNVE